MQPHSHAGLSVKQKFSNSHAQNNQKKKKFEFQTSFPTSLRRITPSSIQLKHFRSSHTPNTAKSKLPPFSQESNKDTKQTLGFPIQKEKKKKEGNSIGTPLSSFLFYLSRLINPKTKTMLLLRRRFDAVSSSFFVFFFFHLFIYLLREAATVTRGRIECKSRVRIWPEIGKMTYYFIQAPVGFLFRYSVSRVSN